MNVCGSGPGIGAPGGRLVHNILLIIIIIMTVMTGVRIMTVTTMMPMMHVLMTPMMTDCL